MSKIFLSAASCFSDTNAFEKIASQHNRTAVCLSDTPQTNAITWRKASPISTKTAIIKAESAHKKIDEVLYYFNEVSLAAAIKNLTAHDCMKLLEEECAGFQFLTLELLSRLASQNRSEEDRAKIIFLVRKNFSLIELYREGMDLALGSLPHVSAAAATFMAFSENIATMYEKKNVADFFLVLADCADETFKSDEELCKWLFQYLDEVDIKKKSGVQWIKAGSRASRFSLFSRS